MLPDISQARAHELIDKFSSRRITVVGDVMLDRFLIGRVSRMSPEAPVPVVVFDHEEFRLGGAANVANNLRELGGAVDLIGVIGDDESGAQLKNELAAKGIHSTGLITDPERRTTTKMRVVTTRNQQVSRIDFESDHEVGAAIEDAIASQVDMRARSAQVVLVSDYQKGVVTRRSMAHLVSFAHANGVPVIVDPKVPHIDYYAGAALVTPNHIEAESATNSRISTHDDAQTRLSGAAAADWRRERADHPRRARHVAGSRRRRWLPAGVRARSRRRHRGGRHGDRDAGAGDCRRRDDARGRPARQRSGRASSSGKFGAATVTPQELKERF